MHKKDTMITYKELEIYYQKLNTAFNSKETSSHYNSDRTHNAMVMCFMLDKSSSINMYCGQLSVFRESFFNHIKKDNTDNDTKNDISDELKEKLRGCLTNFLDQENVSFNVIFESYNEEYSKDLLYKDEFLSGIENDKIHFYKLDDSLSFKKDLYHFSYTNSQIVRLEQDKMKHSAICTIKDLDIYNSAKNNFLKLLSLAQSVKIQ